ncbi:NAD(P)/FAD-dependent oxidoreductase [Selenomonas ruminantium]|uniref:Thioredoxin reductase (NADPH) n=1 Tax=Selenomonas ruminantium TaxID=971 RepID=A0A1H0VGH8_SELRU|nr:NAD(P)/FAD-dependent oxidoreductase [Selenomonas ruminantium]SDP77652.1 thioredoxin reductase (NADPH) [Selenomonas ruminantium]
MSKVLIIGSGPAGVSAALYARRGGAEVTVLSKGLELSGLAKAEKIENYYGLAEPISGAELYARGIEGAKKIGVEFLEDELLSLMFNDDFTGFKVTGKAHVFEADAVIVATGASRQSLNVPGVKEFEGKGVSYCATCDAFFYRGKTVAVVGAGEYALHEAQSLLPHAAQVYMLTNGAALTAEVTADISVHTEKIAAIAGGERVAKVVFADGTELSLDGVFMALGTAGSTAIAKKIGAQLDGNRIKIDAHGATNVPGLFAAGDCTGGLLQVAKAVYQGAEAGLAAVKYLRGKNKPSH